MQLIDSYLQAQDNWASHVPAGSGTLLAVNASIEETQFYQSKGWNVRILALSPGLQALWSNDSQVLKTSAFLFKAADFPQRFDALTWNDSAALFLDIPGLLAEVLQLLHPQGTAYLNIRNDEFIKPALRASGREMLLWPAHSPCERGSSIGHVQQVIQGSAFNCRIHLENTDSVYEAAVANDQRRIKGYDSLYHLPGPVQQNRDLFVRNRLITLSRAARPQLAPASPVPSVTPVQEPEEHNAIQQYLERMEYEPAQLLLRKLFYSGRATGQTYNLQGIWHFLQEQPTLAWENFKLAIEKDPSNLDFYFNFVDANRQCRKDVPTRELLTKFQHQHLEIKGLLDNV